MIIKCPECGHQVSDRARTCPSCGVDIAGNVTRCPDCGEVIFKDQSKCPYCQSLFAGGSVGSAAAADQTPADDDTAQPQPAQPTTGGGRKKRKTGCTVLGVAFVIALVLVCLAFYFYQTTVRENEQRAYENAMQSDQPAVLQNYLDMFGSQASQAHCDTIAARLKSLEQLDVDWANAVASGLKAEIVKYMKLHPNSIHRVEADYCIDSIDWSAAHQADTPEAYQAYLKAHPDGRYIDEARTAYEVLDAQQLKPEDKQMVEELFSTFFTALAKRDKAMLLTTLAGRLSSFLHKDDAAPADVVAYMDKLHEADIQQMTFTMKNDWQIRKQQEAEGLYSYIVDFTVDQMLERSDATKERQVAYTVQARISTDCKISRLNMKKTVK